MEYNILYNQYIVLGEMETEWCKDTCKYLNKKYNCCVRPELNGRGVLLKKTKEGKYVRNCKTLPKEKSCKIHKTIIENICNVNCPYLIQNLGCCIRPELNNRVKKLMRVKDTEYFFKECDKEFENTKKKNKYQAKKVEVDGILYDSQLEYERFCELSVLQKAGEISELQYHKRYVLINKNKNGREIAYEADFVYKDKDGKTIVEDVKSKPTKTRLYALKKRLMLERYGIKIQEYMK